MAPREIQPGTARRRISPSTIEVQRLPSGMRLDSGRNRRGRRAAPAGLESITQSAALERLAMMRAQSRSQADAMRAGKRRRLGRRPMRPAY